MTPIVECFQNYKCEFVIDAEMLWGRGVWGFFKHLLRFEEYNRGLNEPDGTSTGRNYAQRDSSLGSQRLDLYFSIHNTKLNQTQ